MYHIQGCTLAAPDGPWCLNFAPGQLENLSTCIFMEIVGYTHPGF